MRNAFTATRGGHWFRNYKKYLEEHKKKKESETSTSYINVIEINIAVSSSDLWIFDTGSMIHTYKLLQGLSLTRRFTNGELDVRVDNGAKVVVGCSCRRMILNRNPVLCSASMEGQ
jgi:hypothetical protein